MQRLAPRRQQLHRLADAVRLVDAEFGPMPLDRVVREAEWQDRRFAVIDTGGLGFMDGGGTAGGLAAPLRGAAGVLSGGGGGSMSALYLSQARARARRGRLACPPGGFRPVFRGEIGCQ